LDGDFTDPATERVEVRMADGSLTVKTKPLPGDRKLCLTKMKDRAQFGYLECNSAFYKANLGSAAAATLLRGIFSLGILTVSDASSGNTGFTVSLDQQALEAATIEARLIDFAKEAAPLVDYREAFALAVSSAQLKDFIANHEDKFDPEFLVAKAKEKLPLAIEQEDIRARQNADAAARRTEALRQQELRRNADAESVREFQTRIRPGDRVKVARDRYTSFYGMVIEAKPPLAYVQWENVTPQMQWVRLDVLLPPN
jgi:hypothetical protein